MNTFKSLFLTSKGFGFVMFLLFIFGIGVTIKNLQDTQTANTNASISVKIQQLTRFSHAKAHHPLRQRSLYTRVLPFSGAGLGYTPTIIRNAYHLPASGGNGTIAIIDAFNTPSAEADLGVFDSQFNLPACTKANGCFTELYESGKVPPTDPSNQWPLETDLDIEWAHAIAPNAKILLVETTSDNMNDLISGTVLGANQSNVIAISMSWGYPGEFSQETQGDQYLTSPFGATFFAASGDSGNGTSWPATSPNVISVGGTTLILNGNSFTETAWSGSGGGVSQYESEPSYQSSYGIPNAQNHRAIPDVSMVADPNTGCLTYVAGSWYIMGGTSLATPIWAAISSLGNKPVTQNVVYQNAKSNYSYYYNDIIQGNNGTCSTYCSAMKGYDFVTGLGSPIALPYSVPSGISATPTPTTKPTATPTPKATPSPTNKPTATPTDTPKPTPTVIPTATPTPNPNGTYLNVIVGFHGIGYGGDNVNPNSIGNMNPKHLTRSLSIALTDLQNKAYGPYTSQITFDQTSGLFKGNISLGSLPSGQYQIKVSSPEYLTKLIPSLIQITQKQTAQLSNIFLVTGDIDQSNSLSILDYNILADCYGTKQSTSSCKHPPTQSTFGADLDDSGTIDGIDYNLFIRELSVQQGN